MAYEGFYRGAPPVGRLFRNNDIIPILGFGTGTGYFERPEAVAEGMLLAFNAGYRLIDTAQVNENSLDITNSTHDILPVILYTSTISSMAFYFRRTVQKPVLEKDWPHSLKVE